MCRLWKSWMPRASPPELESIRSCARLRDRESRKHCADSPKKPIEGTLSLRHLSEFLGCGVSDYDCVCTRRPSKQSSVVVAPFDPPSSVSTCLFPISDCRAMESLESGCKCAKRAGRGAAHLAEGRDASSGLLRLDYPRAPFVHGTGAGS